MRLYSWASSAARLTTTSVCGNPAVVALCWLARYAPRVGSVSCTGAPVAPVFPRVLADGCICSRGLPGLSGRTAASVHVGTHGRRAGQVHLSTWAPGLSHRTPASAEVGTRGCRAGQLHLSTWERTAVAQDIGTCPRERQDPSGWTSSNVAADRSVCRLEQPCPSSATTAATQVNGCTSWRDTSGYPSERGRARVATATRDWTVNGPVMARARGCPLGRRRMSGTTGAPPRMHICAEVLCTLSGRKRHSRHSRPGITTIRCPVAVAFVHAASISRRPTVTVLTLRRPVVISSTSDGSSAK
jgi:hypothetical protein